MSLFDRRSFLQGLGAGALATLAGCTHTAAARPAPVPAFGSVDTEAFWRAVRAQYRLRHDPVYLNTGGLGPASQPVLDVLVDTTLRLQERSEHEHEPSFSQSREALARFLGITSDEVCFTRNTTEGNSIIAAGLPLAAGDEVIFESHAHPGGSFPWANQARQRGVKVLIFEPDHDSAEGNLERIRELVTPRTKVIQISHATCTTGLIFPAREIAEFARERGIWFHIDGAQTIGMMPVDIGAIGCDSYAFCGHKWLGGPHESGGLYIRRDQLEVIAPTGIGAYSGEWPDFAEPMKLSAAASRHEYGTRNAAQVIALAEAVRFQESIGPGRIGARGKALAEMLLEGFAKIEGITILTPRAAEMRGSMTTIRHPRANSAQFSAYMGEKGLRCRVVTEQGLEALRISTHLFNSPAECERIIAAVQSSVRDL